MQRKCLILAGLLVFWAGCGSSASPDLEKSVNAVEETISGVSLKKSCFSYFYPGGKASDYVNYYFSSLGRMEWPMSAESPEYMPGMEQAAGMAVIPSGVAIIPQRPDATQARQVVVTFDEGKNVVVLEGYDDPTKPPAIRRELTLRPPAAPEQFTVMTCQSNAEAGMSFTSF